MNIQLKQISTLLLLIILIFSSGCVNESNGNNDFKKYTIDKNWRDASSNVDPLTAKQMIDLVDENINDIFTNSRLLVFSSRNIYGEDVSLSDGREIYVWQVRLIKGVNNDYFVKIIDISRAGWITVQNEYQVSEIYSNYSWNKNDVFIDSDEAFTIAVSNETIKKWISGKDIIIDIQNAIGPPKESSIESYVIEFTAESELFRKEVYVSAETGEIILIDRSLNIGSVD